MAGRFKVAECYDIADAGKHELIIVSYCSLASGFKVLTLVSERETE